jgi:hypothetical protein
MIGTVLKILAWVEIVLGALMALVGTLAGAAGNVLLLPLGLASIFAGLVLMALGAIVNMLHNIRSELAEINGTIATEGE